MITNGDLFVIESELENKNGYAYADARVLSTVQLGRT